MIISVDLQKLIEPAVNMLGFELWGLESGKHLLRIYIESSAGVTLDDCEKVSHQLSTLLDVEDPMSDEYYLEVSSPGMDRRIFKEEQYKLYVDKKIKLRTREAMEGQRRFTGVLNRVTEIGIQLIVDGNEIEIPFANIEKANLVAEF